MFEVGAPITAIGLEFAVWFGGLTGLLQGCSSFGSGSCNAEAEVGFTIASMLLAPVGLAGAVTAAGAAARANGSFGASLLGATLGGLAAFGSVAILAASDEDEGIVVPLGFTLSAALPVIGAVVGYELSVGPAASQAPEVPAFGVAATPDGAFVSLSGAL